MDRHMPMPGERYMHFKHKRYQVLCVAKHAETGERMVVYQALYGEYACYVRTLAQFMSEVDHAKYPDAAQRYRFERIVAAPEKKTAEEVPVHAAEPARSVRQTEDASARRPSASDAVEEGVEERANPLLLQFLDADTLEQKYQLIKNLGDSITDRLIDDFAVVLDLVIPEGGTDDRYQQLLSSVRMMQKFETTRFRR